MVGLDVNVLVAAYREEDPFHAPSRSLLESLSGSPAPFAVFWPSLYGFLRVITHPALFDHPIPPERAAGVVEAWASLPNLRFLTETSRHAGILADLIRESGATGNLVYDAHLVALAIEHGVDEILTFDADFRRFPQVRSRHPFRT